MSKLTEFFCIHEVQWFDKQFTGVYPPMKRGVCLKCGKNFDRKVGDDNESNFRKASVKNK